MNPSLFPSRFVYVLAEYGDGTGFAAPPGLRRFPFSFREKGFFSKSPSAAEITNAIEAAYEHADIAARMKAVRRVFLELRVIAGESESGFQPGLQVEALFDRAEGDTPEGAIRLIRSQFPRLFWSESARADNAVLDRDWPELLQGNDGTILSRTGMPKSGVPVQSARIAQHVDARFRASIGIAFDESGQVLANPVLKEHLRAYVDRVGDRAEPPLEESERAQLLEKIFQYNGNDGWYRRFSKQLFLSDCKNPNLSKREAAQSAYERALRVAPISVPGGATGMEYGFACGVTGGSKVLCPKTYWGAINLKAEHYDTLASDCEYVDGDGVIRPDRLRAALEQARRQRYKRVTLYFNFPHNPSGAMPTKAQAKELADVVQESARDGFFINIICDEPYDPFTRDSADASGGNRVIDRPFSSYMVPGQNKNMLTMVCRNGTKRFGVYGFRHADFAVLTPENVSEAVIVAVDSKLRGLRRGLNSFGSALNEILTAVAVTGNPRMCLEGLSDEETREAILRYQEQYEAAMITYMAECSEAMTAACSVPGVQEHLKLVGDPGVDAAGGFFISLQPTDSLRAEGVTADDIHCAGVFSGNCGVIATNDYVRINATAIAPGDRETFVRHLAAAVELAKSWRAAGRDPQTEADEVGDFESLFWQRVERSLYRYLLEIPEERGERSVVEHRDRLFDETVHPTQLTPNGFQGAFLSQIKESQREFRRMRNEGGEAEWTNDFCRLRARSLRDALQAAFVGKVRRFSNAKIEPHHLSDHHAELQGDGINVGVFMSIDESDDPDDFLLTRVYPSCHSQNGTVYDETIEFVQQSKFLIANGICSRYVRWADRDGIKVVGRDSRAPGEMFTQYLDRMRADIEKGIRLGLAENCPDLLGQYHDALLAASENDEAIFELTLLLQTDRANGRRPLLEGLMEKAKAHRKDRIVRLKTILNRLKKEQEKLRAPRMTFVSDRISFHPRIDPKCTAALRWYMSLDPRPERNNIRQYIEALEADPAQANPPDGAIQLLDLAWNIALQVYDLNEIGRVSEAYAKERDFYRRHLPAGVKKGSALPIVPQVMLSQCGTSGDGVHEPWKRALEELGAWGNFLREVYGRESGTPVYSVQMPVSMVPLFETPETTDPEYIQSYLRSVFATMAHSDPYVMNRDCSEIFIAGSDLSRLMGQEAARVQFEKVCSAVDEFNRRYGTDVRVKFGCGEAPNRQGGDISEDAGLSLLRGKLRDDCPDSTGSEELRLRRFLREKFGQHYQRTLTTPMSGVVDMAEQFPLHAVTVQSRFRDRMRFVEWSRLRWQFERWRRAHDRDFALDHQGRRTRFAPPLSAYEAGGERYFLELARRHGFTRYREIMGAPSGEGSEKGKPGPLGDGNVASLPGLIEVIAKLVPKVRPRPSARPGNDNTLASEVYDLAHTPEVNARAISVTAASSLLMPAFLLDKRAILEGQEQNRTLTRYLSNFRGVRNLLKQMLMFATVRPTTCRILRQNGLSDVADLLDREWEGLVRFVPALQQELRDRICLTQHQNELELVQARGGQNRLIQWWARRKFSRRGPIDTSSWSVAELQMFARAQKPLFRELLDPSWAKGIGKSEVCTGQFLAKGTLAWQRQYERRASILLDQVCEQVNSHQRFLRVLDEVAQTCLAEQGGELVEIKKNIIACLQGICEGDAILPAAARESVALQSAFAGLSRFEPSNEGLVAFDELLAAFGFVEGTMG
ncbi:MAG: aminotransferase class I/II-fold pyridoxal phosphate-dependent enzyme [bacterium]|nr:aminotransferase class I/II-fold pyridoxal phosphate-dependent enzyme [bacterium]